MFKNLTTSKKLVYFLFLNCTIIELFVLAITLVSVFQSTITGIPADFSPLNTLVGAFVVETVAYAVYALKSMKENVGPDGGVVYLKVKNEVENEEGDETEADG